MQASGTSDTLRELGAEFGVDVAVMDLLGEPSNEEGTVSSSEVRAYSLATWRRDACAFASAPARDDGHCRCEGRLRMAALTW